MQKITTLGFRNKYGEGFYWCERDMVCWCVVISACEKRETSFFLIRKSSMGLKRAAGSFKIRRFFDRNEYK